MPIVRIVATLMVSVRLLFARIPPARGTGRIAEPQSSYDHYYNKAFESYQALLEDGETKEQARQVLPVYSPTKLVAQWNLRSLFHIFDERLNLHTQMATRLTVEEIKKAVAEVFPTLVGFWDKEQEGEE